MNSVAPRSRYVKSVPPIGVPFAPIPLDVMRRSDLTPAAKLVFAALANDARMRRGDASAWTNAQVAEAVGMTASGVRRPLDELEDAGLIRRAYGETERVRASVAITYAALEVGAPASTPASNLDVERQPGRRPSAKGVGAPASTLLSTKNEERERSPSFSTSGGEGDPDPKPTSEEIAACLRAMVAGTFDPALFEAKADAPPAPPGPTPAPDAPAARPPDRPQARPNAPEPPRPRPAPVGSAPPRPRPAPAKDAAPIGLPDLATMCRRVGYSAVAAIARARPPRKSAAEQIAELRRRSAARPI
jgi:hypothetical protein